MESLWDKVLPEDVEHVDTRAEGHMCLLVMRETEGAEQNNSLLNIYILRWKLKVLLTSDS